jgi:hypothetical protein
MMGLEGAALHTAVSLQSEFARVHTVNESMDTEEDFRLRTVGINALKIATRRMPANVRRS